MIDIQHLRKYFNGRPVLRDVNLYLERGETVAVIGRSGCGKSVLLKHVVGLIRPDSGKVIVDGVDVFSLGERELSTFRRRFGVLFQGGALLDSLTVGENIALPLREHTNLSEDDVRERVSEKLSIVGLPGIEDMMPSELSGGMKKRVALARALIMEPEIILYDEPTTGLDPIMSAIITKLICDLKEEFSITSIVVTHDMTSAVKVADRIAMLHRGVIIFDGEPEEVGSSTDPVVHQFVNGLVDGPIKPIPGF